MRTQRMKDLRIRYPKCFRSEKRWSLNWSKGRGIKKLVSMHLKYARSEERESLTHPKCVRVKSYSKRGIVSIMKFTVLAAYPKWKIC